MQIPLFAISVDQWNLHAIPYFVLLGMLCGFNSIYLTKCMFFCKAQFSRLSNHSYKILLGGAIISILLFVFPQLYGDGYHAIRESILTANTLSLTIPHV